MGGGGYGHVRRERGCRSLAASMPAPSRPFDVVEDWFARYFCLRCKYCVLCVRVGKGGRRVA